MSVKITKVHLLRWKCERKRRYGLIWGSALADRSYFRIRYSNRNRVPNTHALTPLHFAIPMNLGPEAPHTSRRMPISINYLVKNRKLWRGFYLQNLRFCPRTWLNLFVRCGIRWVSEPHHFSPVALLCKKGYSKEYSDINVRCLIFVAERVVL